MHFSVPSGTVTAMSNRNDNRAYYTFGGDLNQMGLIERYLRSRGFAVVKSGVYPGFPRDAEKEYIRALREVWENRVEGWWSQQERLLQYGICTEDEYKAALDVECAKER